MSNITEDQHYIPQFYLKQWIDNDGGFYPIKIEQKIPPKLKIFSKKSDQSRFCYENFFYAQYTGKKDEVSQLIEKDFAKIEAMFSNELPLFIKKILNYEHITEADKHRLSQFMIFLHFKGKKYLDQSKKMTEDMTKQIMRHHAQYIDKDPKMKAKMEELNIDKDEYMDYIQRGEFSVDYGNLHHLRIMEDMEGFCNLLRYKYWKVYISREGGFITTDAPYMDIPLSNTFYGNDFLSREQIFILSPQIMIVAMYPQNSGGKKFVRKDITGKRALIQSLNTHVLDHSIKFGFHKDRDLLIELDKCVQLIYSNKNKVNK